MGMLGRAWVGAWVHGGFGLILIIINNNNSMFISLKCTPNMVYIVANRA